ncbi:hypothetical protein F4678DRAFT_446967 [Xylaria arbuscula]|nr:hypothetical protein F4678DRAFT_446967 [Xylaria arbuscula]
MVRSVPKCDICRKRKQKCDRQPGQKCEFCIEKALPCSDNRTTKEERRRRNGPQTTARLPPSLPSTIGQDPLFRECLLLLSYRRMLSSVESAGNDIHARALAGNRARFERSFGNPEVLREIELCSEEITSRLWHLTIEISELPNVSHRVELSSIIQARVEAHPSRHELEFCLNPLRRITAAATGTESQNLHDIERSLTDIEREVETIINGPKLYSNRKNDGQFTATYTRTLESLRKRFTPILDDGIILPVPFVHDLWYQHVWERDTFFSDLLAAPALSMFRQDSLRRTWLHFAVEGLRFKPPFRIDIGKQNYPLYFVGADIQLLLQSQPSSQIDAQDAFGRTALHIACAFNKHERRGGQLRVVRILLENNARIDLCDHYGRRAIDYAIIDHNDRLLSIFQRIRGIDLDGIHSAIIQFNDAINSALDASSLACQRPETKTK